MKKTSITKIIAIALLIATLFSFNVITASAGVQKGWVEKNGKYYYYDENGCMYKDDNYYIDGEYYYFDKNGAMVTGWYQDEYGCWHYFESDGTGKTGWLKSGGKWYYCQNGYMYYDSEVYIDGKLYSFDENGVWVA